MTAINHRAEAEKIRNKYGFLFAQNFGAHSKETATECAKLEVKARIEMIGEAMLFKQSRRDYWNAILQELEKM